MLQLRQRMGLHQRLTPAQVQYLKLLQLPVAQLEDRIREELEDNPMLEESPQDELPEDTLATSVETSFMGSTPGEEQTISTSETVSETRERDRENDYSMEDFMNDELEGYKAPRSRNYDEEDNSQDRGQAAEETLTESLSRQLSLLVLAPRLKVLAQEIIGSLDSDGYFRMPLEQIVQDTEIYYGEEFIPGEAERLLKRIQRLDPVGIASRNLQECLLVQLETMNDAPAKSMAVHILTEYFDLFIKKNYPILAKKLHVKLHDLKPALDLIQRLNPKPGAPSAPMAESRKYITPDFYIEKTPDQKEFIITLNERGVPSIRINASYKELAKRNTHPTDGQRPLSEDAKEFINKKFESAKLFVLAYYQRRKTLLSVMQAIVARQNEFFLHGEKHLKPLIYKNIAEDISMDISTICRVVNSKYCQCDHGVYELKYFFSEAISLDTTEEGDGEASSELVSNKVVKNRIKELIAEENPMKPLTDDEIGAQLRSVGYELARRTVAKYREQMNIPVARMRKRIV